MGIYWETLTRWINTRALAVDKCNAAQSDPDVGWRLLNVPSIHNTKDTSGVLPARVGMEVRFKAARVELKKYSGARAKTTGHHRV
eukprot:2565905-Pyramimonas_sp.AAC.1